MSFRRSPASRQLALVKGGDVCAAVVSIRQRERFMTVLGRKAPVVFKRRVYGSVIDFDWTRFSLDLSKTRLLVLGWSASRKSFSEAEAAELPSVLSVYFILTEECVLLHCESNAMIKAAYAVRYTPIRQENNPRNSLIPVPLTPQPYPHLKAEPEGKTFNCLYSNPTRK